jgi:hypothetical protein
MAELSRPATRAWVCRRLALMRQADIFALAASGPTRVRGIVGAADQAVVTGAVRPAVTRAPLAGASLEVALILPHAVARTAGKIGGVRAARQPVVAAILHAGVATATAAGAGRRWWTQRVAADRGRRASAWSPRRTVWVVRAAEQRRVATGVLCPGGAIAADARSRRVGADLLRLGRGASCRNPKCCEQTRHDTGAAGP